MLQAAGFPLPASLLVSMAAGPPPGTGGAEAAGSGSPRQVWRSRNLGGYRAMAVQKRDSEV
jgi:hypothetical protein